eukprot:Polyplicarium_translucidae@DN1202_c0_g1_i2.p1
MEWVIGRINKDYTDAARQEESDGSAEILEELIDDWLIGNVSQSRQQEMLLLGGICHLLTPETLLDRCTEVLSFLVDYFHENASGSLFVSAPEKNLEDEETYTLAYQQQLDDDSPGCEKPPLPPSQDEGLPFVIDADEILRVTRTAVENPGPREEVLLPPELVKRAEIDQLIAEASPHLVPLPIAEQQPGALSPSIDLPDGVQVHAATGTILWRLQNGAAFNAKATKFEPHSATVKVSFAGGTLMETDEEKMCLEIGVRSLLDGGAGGIPQAAIARLVGLWGISTFADAGREFLTIGLSFDSSDPVALTRVFQLLHIFLRCPDWDIRAFERHKRAAAVSLRASQATLEHRVTETTAFAVYPKDSRMWLPTVDTVTSLEFERVKRVIARQLQPCVMEISIVGEFSVSQAVSESLRFIGTLPPFTPPSQLHLGSAPVPFASYIARGVTGVKPPPPVEEDATVAAFLRDERGVDSSERDMEKAYIVVIKSGIGKYETGAADSQARHRTWRLLEDIISQRLVRELRERRSLSYAVDFILQPYETYPTGTTVVGLTPVVGRCTAAWAALQETLFELAHSRPPTADELFAGPEASWGKPRWWHAWSSRRTVFAAAVGIALTAMCFELVRSRFG